MSFRKHSDADNRRRSAVMAIKAILPLPLTRTHRRKFLSLATWMLTEADGKYNTRYRSACAIKAPKNTLRHEHIYRRKKMISDLIANPAAADTIAARAVACVVTKDEHDWLHMLDEPVDGWERYKQAGIVVIDMETNSEADIDALIAEESRADIP